MSIKHANKENPNSKDHRKALTITINGKSYQVRPGQMQVTEIKCIGSVPNGDELVQIVDEEIVPLDDDARVHIRGDEIFVSHPRQGKSS